jgi:hypothetical protein
MDWGLDERGLNRVERCEGCGEEFPYASGDLTECQLNENYDACGLEQCEECHEKTHVREVGLRAAWHDALVCLLTLSRLYPIDGGVCGVDPRARATTVGSSAASTPTATG